MANGNGRQLLGGFLGAFLGGYYGAIGSQLGFLGGSYVFRPGESFPRGSDDELRVQTSGYGYSIPNIVGTQRVAGNIIWARPLTEYKWQDGVTGYKLTCAIALCQGPVVGWNRIWINDELKVDCTDGTGRCPGIGTFYNGTQVQTVNSTMASLDGGTSNHPAYRGICYVVLNEFDLGPNRSIPKFEWQVMKSAF